MPTPPGMPSRGRSQTNDPARSRLGEVLGLLGDSDKDLMAFKRALDGGTNDVFLAPNVAIRISREPGVHTSLAREARISGTIPPQTGYPAQIDWGMTSDRHVWIASEYIAGRPLAGVILDMGPDEQRDVMQGINDVLQAVHHDPHGTPQPRPQWPGNHHNSWLIWYDHALFRGQLLRLMAGGLISSSDIGAIMDAHQRLRTAFGRGWQADDGAGGQAPPGSMTTVTS